MRATIAMPAAATRNHETGLGRRRESIGIGSGAGDPAMGAGAAGMGAGRGVARGEIVGRGGEDAALQGGRRLDGLDGLGQRRHHRTKLGELLVRQRTRAEVLANRLLLVGLERVQHERGGKFDRFLVGQSRPVVHGAAPCSRRWRRIASSASRIRPLTVPSGAPVLAAISCCVSPPK